MLGTIIAFTLMGSVGALLLAALFLFIPDTVRKKFSPWMISFATGTLLGAAFLRLIPEALEGGLDAHVLGYTVLGGILLFFTLEKLVLWRHCHEGHRCEAHGKADGSLILIGDGFHNLADGFVIGAAFLHSKEVGIVTALALIAHELPQELGDFVILLESGFSKLRAFVYNLLSSLPAVVGAVGAYYGLQDYQALIPFVLAVSAASFLYVAIADLVPTLHKKLGFKPALSQLSLIGLGITLIACIGHAH